MPSSHRYYHSVAILFAYGIYVSVDALVSLSRISTPSAIRDTTNQYTYLRAKRRNKNEQARQDIEQFNRWYDRVDDDATPDNVFWDEMERQRMLTNPSSSSSSSASVSSSSNLITPISMSSSSSSASSSSNDMMDKYPGIFMSPMMGPSKGDVPGIAEERSVEATLASFAQFMVSDNWLDEKYIEFHGDRNLFNGKDQDFLSLDEQNASLDQDIDDWQHQEEDDGDGMESSSSPIEEHLNGERDKEEREEEFSSSKDFKRRMNMFARSNEPWDYYEKELQRKEMINKKVKSSSSSLNINSDEDVEDDDDDDLYEWKIRIDPQKGMSNALFLIQHSKRFIAYNISHIYYLFLFLFSFSANHPLAKQFLVNFDRNTDDTIKANNNGIEDSSATDSAWEQAREEADHLSRLAKIRIQSARLENARLNPKAKTFFSRPPNAIEGYERMWVSAIDNCCMPNLVGSFRNYGIEFADNFGDWVDGCEQDRFCTIEDIASYKARMVYQVTGLPCIASRTSFEVEPVPVPSGIDARQLPSRAYINPRIVSGYRFNDVGEHVDYIVEALKLFSDPSRVTRFRSCFCFYDGSMEFFEYGELDCDLYFSNSIRTYIPMSHGINEICKTLQLTFSLEYQVWLRAKVREALGAGEHKASIKLRDRVLKEAKVLPNDIIDVSAFMDSQVDVALMDECGKELSQRFEKMKPTKILTVATTGATKFFRIRLRE